MNRKVSAILMLVAMASMAVVVNISNEVFADNDYCYDQAGNGHFCFHQIDTCKHQQGHDDIAETPCYNKDRTS